MKNRFWKRVALVFAVVLSVVLFFVAREAASWKPQKLEGVSSPNGIFAVSPDGRYIANSPTGTRVTLSELASGKEEFQLHPHNATALCLHFSPNGKQLAICWEKSSHTSVAVLWNGGKTAPHLEATPPQHYEGFRQFRFAPDGETLWMLTARRLIEWDARSGKLRSVVKLEDIGMALSADAKTVFWSNWLTVGTMNARTGANTAEWKTGLSPFETIKFSPLGRYFLSDQPKAWHVYDVANRRALWSFSRVNTTYQNWLFSPDEKFLFVANENIIEVREMPSGRVVRRLPRQPEADLLAVSADGTTLFTHKDSVVYKQRAR